MCSRFDTLNTVYHHADQKQLIKNTRSRWIVFFGFLLVSNSNQMVCVEEFIWLWIHLCFLLVYKTYFCRTPYSTNRDVADVPTWRSFEKNGVVSERIKTYESVWKPWRVRTKDIIGLLRPKLSMLQKWWQRFLKNLDCHTCDIENFSFELDWNVQTHLREL